MGGHVPTFGARLHQALGTCLEWWGCRGAAQQAFADALRADPCFADPHVRLAESLARQGRWREAARHLEQVVPLRPHDPEVHGNLALARARGRQWHGAIAAIDGLIRVRPHEAEPHVLRGALLTRLGRRAEAIRSFRWAVRLPPGPEWRRFFLGEELLGREAWGAAHSAYETARRLEPATATARSSDATSVLNAHPGGPMLDPLACSERSSRRAPSKRGVPAPGRALASLAWGASSAASEARLRLASWVLPRQAHRTLRALRGPRRTPGWVPHGSSLAGLTLLLALAAPPSPAETPQARDQARICFSSSGETAVMACQQALDLGLQHDRASMAYRTLAAELAALHRWNEMVEAYRGLVRLRPEDPEARYHLGRALLEVQGQPAAAARELERAVSLRGDTPRYLGSLGAALNATGRYDEAVAALERARQLDPDYFTAHPAAEAVLTASRAGRTWP